ncbi:hypothetical protein [Aureispira sp. CCB-QB1]|uniref:hypothetical protein n=1 Tax=Aureispira sp. CCB-QB1 TaxID=1313421 RepID=UPI00069828E3|nr:hypothetical protein [Aureispira sp. CCB-QB1]
MKKIILGLFLANTLVIQAQTTPIHRSSRSVLNSLLAPIHLTTYNQGVFIVNTVADLSNPLNAGKVACIQDDLVLTSNLTIASGIILKDCGGVIVVGNNEITFQNNSFDFPYNRIVVDLGQHGTINDASTFGNGDINIVNFGLVGDGDLATNSGTDNRNVFLQAMKIFNSCDGQARIEGKGNYLYSVIPSNLYGSSTPNNFYLTGKASLTLDPDVVLGCLTNGHHRYDIVTFWNAKETFLRGGLIVGDLRTHDFSATTSEGCHGVVVYTNSEYITIETPVIEVPGDCMNARYNPEFIHMNKVVEAAFTKNSTIDETGAIVASNDFSYSKEFSVNRNTFRTNGIVFGGGSYAGFFGLDIQQYWMVFYDNSGAFISKSDILETYRRFKIPANAASVRLVIYNPSDWSLLKGTLYAPNYPQHITYRPPYLKRGVRQGISNPPPNSTITNIRFEENGRRFDGTTGSPGFAIDVEDGYQNLNQLTISKNTFLNNKGGDIILKGTINATIYDNRFLYNTIPGFVNVNAVSLGNGTNSKFYNNLVQDRILSLGRGSSAYDNTLMDVTVLFSLEDETLINNTQAHNVRFGKVLGEGESVAYIKNNMFTYDKPLHQAIPVFKFSPHWIWMNNSFDFKHQTVGRYHNLAYASVGNVAARGYIDGFTIKNLKAVSSGAHYYGMAFPAMNIKNYTSSISTSIIDGAARDLVFENMYIEGWFDLRLTNFASSNSGNDNNYPTIHLKNVNISIENKDEVRYTRYAFRTANKDCHILWKEGSLKMKIGDSEPSSNRFFDVDHYGTLTFDNVQFSSETAVTMNTNNATCGKITYVDCEFENVVCPLRAGDEMIWTNKEILKTQTNLTYSIEIDDRNDTVVRMDNVGANTVIIPTEATVPMVVGDKLRIKQVGVGITTLVADTGVVLRGNLTSPRQYSIATLIKIGADEWEVSWN